jgi:surface polysaccharide O-acyltransferase-like enzyme
MGHVRVKTERGCFLSIGLSTNKSVMNQNQPIFGGHVIWIDLLRIICTLMVIAIHWNYPYSEVSPDKIPVLRWFATAFLDNYFRCAVPLFVMISGYLLLNKKSLLNKYFMGRLTRLVIPLLAWSFIYFAVQRITNGTDSSGHQITLFYCIRGILTGNVAHHLWFLSMMLSVYLAAPILHAVVHSGNQIVIKYVIFLWLIVSFVFPIVSEFSCRLAGIDKINFSFYVINIYTGCFIAGYFFGSLKISFRLFLSLFAMTVLLSTGSTLTAYYGNTDRIALFGYCKILMILAVFLMVKYLGTAINITSEKTIQWLSYLASLTYGIYLIHYLFLRFIENIGINMTLLFPFFSIPIGVIFIFTVSAFGVAVLKQIPLLRHLVP